MTYFLKYAEVFTADQIRAVREEFHRESVPGEREEDRERRALQIILRYQVAQRQGAHDATKKPSSRSEQVKSPDKQV